MSEPASRDGAGEGGRAGEVIDAGEGGELAELRALLLGPEQIQLATMQQRLDDPAHRAADVSQVLARAVSLSAARDLALSVALRPTVEATLRSSVREDPRPLVDALFPVMGPAIRRAIAAALTAMVQSLNETLEQSLSGRGLRWRLEAWRTGRPFSEVVLLHTLLYRVEQVLLIHRETGLLLARAARDGVDAADADVVAPMLTAIQDFARDCFGAGPGEGLDTFQVGSLTVWVEQGPLALLAAVVRGTAPVTLRTDLQATLETIHATARTALLAFTGDASALAPTQADLRACLQERYAPARRPVRRLGPASMLAAGLVGLLGVWASTAFREHRRWDRYLERLREEPGIVVTDTDRRGGRYLVRGLRDPLARDPAALLALEGLGPDRVVARWEPYQALRPEFVLVRARSVLAPPPGVTVALDGESLVVTGLATRAWITEARRLARVLPGISAIRTDGVVDVDLATLRARSAAVEALVIRFVVGSTRLAPGQADPVGLLAASLRQLAAAARAGGDRARVEVVGHTDRTASEELNLTLSQRRAETIVRAVAGVGADVLALSARGVGPREPLREEETEADRAFNRSVTFRVTLETPPG